MQYETRFLYIQMVVETRFKKWEKFYLKSYLVAGKFPFKLGKKIIRFWKAENLITLVFFLKHSLWTIGLNFSEVEDR